jgi:hypothetical protein
MGVVQPCRRLAKSGAHVVFARRSPWKMIVSLLFPSPWFRVLDYDTRKR